MKKYSGWLDCMANLDQALSWFNSRSGQVKRCVADAKELVGGSLSRIDTPDDLRAKANNLSRHAAFLLDLSRRAYKDHEGLWENDAASNVDEVARLRMQAKAAIESMERGVEEIAQLLKVISEVIGQTDRATQAMDSTAGSNT